MNADASWFPVLTLLLGFLTKSISDYFEDRRISRREERRTSAETVAAARLRRTEFQRSTLLELQEVAGRFVKNVGSVQHHDLMESRKAGKWQRTLLPETLNNDMYQNQFA